MAVSLGRSITHPVFLLSQIVNAVCLFLLFLSLFRVIVAFVVLRMEYAAKYAGTDAAQVVSATVPTFDEVFYSCYRLSVVSLFNGPVDSRVQANRYTTPANSVSDSSRAQFFWMHVGASVALAHPLAVTLQRRKFVPDFVFTIYGAYIVLANVVLRTLFGGGTLSWWATVLCGMAVTYGATWALCRRRELAEISLGGGGGGGGGVSVSVTETGPLAVVVADESDGESGREMQEVRRAAVTPSAQPDTAPPSMRPQTPLPRQVDAHPVPDGTSPPMAAPGTVCRRKDR